jgi:signal transduction histidine kinase
MKFSVDCLRTDFTGRGTASPLWIKYLLRTAELSSKAAEQIAHLQQAVDDQVANLRKAAENYKEVQGELEECQEKLTLVTTHWESEILLQLRTQDRSTLPLSRSYRKR